MNEKELMNLPCNDKMLPKTRPSKREFGYHSQSLSHEGLLLDAIAHSFSLSLLFWLMFNSPNDLVITMQDLCYLCKLELPHNPKGDPVA